MDRHPNLRRPLEPVTILYRITLCRVGPLWIGRTKVTAVGDAHPPGLGAWAVGLSEAAVVERADRWMHRFARRQGGHLTSNVLVSDVWDHDDER